jgi:hypothetical protein
VVRTEPDTFAVVTDLDAPVRFHFDERISEGQAGELDGAVTVSPRTGEVRVDHDRRSLSIEVEGGFRQGLVYRVTLQAVVQDLFGNRLRAPFELVFSTGGEPDPTTLAGEVWDRVQGGGVEGAVVRAVGSDSLVHHAVAGPEGIYALRYLPPGAYDLTAFVDRNRDGEVDAGEVRGTGDVDLASGDTVLVDVSVLAPDTTPAVVLRAEPLDSLTVAVELDDYLDPAAATADVGVALRREDGTAPDVARSFQEHEYVAYVQEVADSLARLDSLDAAVETTRAAAARDSALARDSLRAADAAPTVADTLGLPDPALARDTLPTPDTLALPDEVLPPDTVVIAESVAPALSGADTVPARPARMPPPALPGARALPTGRGSASPDRGRGPLPGTRLVVRLAAPLEPGVDYTLTVSGVRNVNGLEGGGGEVVLSLEIASPEAVPDTSRVVPDTSRVVPDTARVVTDTERVVTDTGAARDRPEGAGG